jgi:cobyric acid synthase
MKLIKINSTFSAWLLLFGRSYQTVSRKYYVRSMYNVITSVVDKSYDTERVNVITTRSGRIFWIAGFY